ncbi:MAG TPA: penicillin binding protein transpeptidase domain-containing protein, partial [Cytophagales bacterium]|nr:penicillin binding protein transpeptidase domain-containing protein [Cytophagales bacterium]
MPYQTFLPYCYKNIICLLLAGMPTYQTWAQTSWQQPFEDCGINGSITIYDYNRQVWMTSDMADSQVGTLPASTFKILNTLIVLETGAIADDHEIIPWISDYDTTKYGHRPSIYKDMDLEEAFYKSAGWAYRELAKKVGDERYLEILTEIGYGNGDLSIDDPDFWNYGAFQVTPTNQVQTMMDIFEEKLPFSPEAYSTLKRLMITEEGEGYVIRAKT